MGFFEITFIAVGLAMDASAVSLVAAATGYAEGRRAVFRLYFHFGLFQFFMTVLGWLLGQGFVDYIHAVDHWVAFGLLAFVGLKMIRSGIKPPGRADTADPSRGMTMVMLSVATSIDALAVGLSLALLHVNIWYSAIIIGVVTGVLSFLAIRIGRRIGTALGQRMEILGGVILIAIGLKILLSSLLV
jgi:putative Mn2+ efflux pump MntP